MTLVVARVSAGIARCREYLPFAAGSDQLPTLRLPFPLHHHRQAGDHNVEKAADDQAKHSRQDQGDAGGRGQQLQEFHGLIDKTPATGTSRE
ncbi:hypothetical protein [Pigmentiphaga litoralis]|uniref:hypothetical protein n=1 Tax=Pigmentiphaga litoralis TaxID=516702 RepID=UPI003B42CDFD